MSIRVYAIGIEEIQSRLKIIQRNTSNTLPIMAGISEILKMDTQDSFKEKTSPFGQPWKESKHWLYKSGRLSSFNTNATAYTAEVYASAEYAAIHQFGGTIKPKNGKYLMFKGTGSRFAKVKQVVIPARPFMPVNSAGQLAPKTEKQIIDYLEGVIFDEKYK